MHSCRARWKKRQLFDYIDFDVVFHLIIHEWIKWPTFMQSICMTSQWSRSNNIPPPSKAYHCILVQNRHTRLLNGQPYCPVPWVCLTKYSFLLEKRANNTCVHLLHPLTPTRSPPQLARGSTCWTASSLLPRGTSVHTAACCTHARTSTPQRVGSGATWKYSSHIGH